MIDVMIVEDDDISRRLVKDHLNLATKQGIVRNGWRFFEYTNLKDAKKALKFIQPDIIVLDLKLPDSWGEETVRGIVKSTKAPVLILSGSYEGDMIDKCVHAGARKYLQKPLLDAKISLSGAILEVLESELEDRQIKKLI